MAEDKKGSSSKTLLFATFVGGVMGAVAGLLLAPQSGKKSREQLQKTYDKTKKSVDDFIKNTGDKIPEIIPKIKEEQEKIKDDILHIARDTEKTLSKTVEKGKSYLEDIKKTALNSIEEGKKKFKEEKEKYQE